MQRKLPSRCLGREEKNFVQSFARHRLQYRKQRADCFADTGRRFGRKTTIRTRCAIHGLRKLPLSLTEAGIWKWQRHQGLIASAAMFQFVRGPLQEAFALLYEEIFELGCRVPLVEQRFL